MDDRNTIVISDALMKKQGIHAGLGDEILLNVNGQKMAWQLVGISREFLANGAYVPFHSFTQAMEHTALATNIVIKTTDPALVDRVARDLEIQLSVADFDVYTMWKTKDSRKVMEDHMAIITGILLVMAVLFVIVGALGLTSTMSMNVLDRTRELGVMRAIGASTLDVMQIIISEGMFTGVLSWVLAVILSVPYSQLMGQAIAMFLESPMDLTTSLAGWAIWFFAILVIASVASAFPAWNAARQPVNEVLAYE